MRLLAKIVASTALLAACQIKSTPPDEGAPARPATGDDPRLRTTSHVDPESLIDADGSLSELAGTPPSWCNAFLPLEGPDCSLPLPPVEIGSLEGHVPAVSLEIEAVLEHFETERITRLAWILESGGWIEGRVLSVESLASHDDSLGSRALVTVDFLVTVDLGRRDGLTAGRRLYFERDGWALGFGTVATVAEATARIDGFTRWPVRAGDFVHPVRLFWRTRETTAEEAFREGVRVLRRELAQQEARRVE